MDHVALRLSITRNLPFSINNIFTFFLTINIAQKHNLSIKPSGFSINKKRWPDGKLFTLKGEEEIER
jgi:hypothetical protein